MTVGPTAPWVAGLAVAVAVLLVRGRPAAERLNRARRARDRSGSPPEGHGALSPGRRPPSPVPVAVVLDLVAAVLDAGAPPSVAVGVVADCLAATGDPAAEALRSCAGRGGPGRTGSPGHPGRPREWGRTGPWTSLQEALQLATSTGLAPAGLVRAAAQQERRRRVAAQAVAARRLAVHVVVPLAACLLPAFILLTIVPVVLDLIPGP